MTNAERCKNPEERTDAFRKYRIERGNLSCIKEELFTCIRCFCSWLDQEAKDEEKPLPCPFCGSDEHILVNKVFEGEDGDETTYVSCESCLYESPTQDTRDDAIAEHNRVARAVMAAKEKEAK